MEVIFAKFFTLNNLCARKKNSLNSLSFLKSLKFLNKFSFLSFIPRTCMMFLKD